MVEAQSFGSVPSAIESICCSVPTYSTLAVHHLPLEDESDRDRVAILQQKIEAACSDIDDAAVQEQIRAHLDPLTLLRFLLARPTVDAAAKMFISTMRWRVERDLGNLYRAIHPAGYPSAAGSGGRKAELAEAFFYGGYVGRTRNGYPLFVERLGRLDLDGMARVGEVRGCGRHKVHAALFTRVVCTLHSTCGLSSRGPVRARARVCMYVCVRACVCVRARARVCVCVCVRATSCPDTIEDGSYRGVDEDDDEGAADALQ